MRRFKKAFQKIIFLSFGLTGLLIFSFPVNSIFAYSNNDEITVARQMPSQAIAGETITVEINVAIGVGISDPIRGFYVTDEVPGDLNIEEGSYTVKLNGSNLTDIIDEIGVWGDVYPGTVPYRLILETPQDFTERNQLNNGDELVMQYEVTVPAAATVGTIYTFPGYNWVGRLINTSENVIGYEDYQNTLEIVANPVNTTTTTITTTTTATICLTESIYGEDSEETKLLRNFRDTILKSTPEGKEIVRLYYQWSPVIVEAMGEDKRFKEALKIIINEIFPLIRTDVD